MAEKEYLERETVMHIAKKYGCDNGGALGRHSGIADIIADKIYAIPAANVRPERHGYWKGYTKSAFCGCDDYGNPIYRDVKIYYCSLCDRKSVVREKFCPNCGAKMDGKEET